MAPSFHKRNAKQTSPSKWMPVGSCKDQVGTTTANDTEVRKSKGSRGRRVDDDEETWVGSGPSDEEVAFSCPSENGESSPPLSSVEPPSMCGCDDFAEGGRINGRHLLALIQEPRSLPDAPEDASTVQKKRTPLCAPSKADGKTKLSTGAALFVPRPGTTLPQIQPPLAPLPPAAAFTVGGSTSPAMPPGHVLCGRDVVRRAAEQAFVGQPWAMCVATAPCPTTGFIDVKIVLSPPMTIDLAVVSLELALRDQGPQIELGNLDQAQGILTCSFAEMPLDRGCWEFLHHGFCPRGFSCRWPHITPEHFSVQMGLNTMTCLSDGTPSAAWSSNPCTLDNNSSMAECMPCEPEISQLDVQAKLDKLHSLIAGSPVAQASSTVPESPHAIPEVSQTVELCPEFQDAIDLALATAISLQKPEEEHSGEVSPVMTTPRWEEEAEKIEDVVTGASGGDCNWPRLEKAASSMEGSPKMCWADLVEEGDDDELPCGPLWSDFSMLPEAFESPREEERPEPKTGSKKETQSEKKYADRKGGKYKGNKYEDQKMDSKGRKFKSGDYFEKTKYAEDKYSEDKYSSDKKKYAEDKYSEDSYGDWRGAGTKSVALSRNKNWTRRRAGGGKSWQAA